MEDSELYQKAELYLTDLYKKRKKEEMIFHNLDRSFDLTKEVEKIAKESDLDTNDSVDVTLAAYFIYSGYWSKEEQPFNSSVDNLTSFLSENGDRSSEPIIGYIHSVVSHEEKKTPAEKVIYDAYYSHFGKKKLLTNLEMIWLEQSSSESEINVLRTSLDLITNHKFRTTYAIHQYGKRKAKNIQKLQSRIDKYEAKSKKTKRKKRKLGRGIETMYRAIYRNHINLSAMADQKANLIIRINTIIISIIITLGGTGFTFFEKGFFKYTRFTVPIILLLLFSLAAVIFAVLSARPKVTKKEVSKKKILGNESSILFFGNFIGMEKKDFLREMRLLKQNDERVYDSMTIDLYHLGLVLDVKYRQVKIAYNLFMCGLVLSVVSFVVIFMYMQLSL